MLCNQWLVFGNTVHQKKVALLFNLSSGESIDSSASLEHTSLLIKNINPESHGRLHSEGDSPLSASSFSDLTPKSFTTMTTSE